MSDRVSFKQLVVDGKVAVGETLYFSRDPERTAIVQEDGTLIGSNGKTGTIHGLGAAMTKSSSCNGWNSWYTRQGETFTGIKHLRAGHLAQTGDLAISGGVTVVDELADEEVAETELEQQPV